MGKRQQLRWTVMTNMMAMVAVFLLCLVFIPHFSDVSAYPQGAPEESCMDMFCHADKPPLAFPFGYTITLSSLTYSPSGEIKGTLTSEAKKHFRGFLLRAVLADSVPESMKGKKASWYSGNMAGRKPQSTLPGRIRRSLGLEELDADFLSGLSDDELTYYLSQPEIVKKIISDPTLMTMLPDNVVQKVFEQNVILNPEEHSKSIGDSNSLYDPYSEEEHYSKDNSNSEKKQTSEDISHKEKGSHLKKKPRQPVETFKVPGSSDTRRRQNERSLRETYPNKQEPSPNKEYEPPGVETVIKDEQPATLPPKTERNGDANRYSKSNACVKQQQLVKKSWNFSPVGHFLTTSSTVKPACKKNGTSGGLTHTDSDKKSSISFIWKAPADLDADIVFHASVVYSKALWWNNIVSTVVTLSHDTSTSTMTTTTLRTPSSTLVTTTVMSSTSASFTTEHTAESTPHDINKGDNYTLSSSKSAETSTMMLGGTSYKTSISMASMTTQHRDNKSTVNNQIDQPEQTSSPVTHSATSSSVIHTRNLARSTTNNRSYENETTTESTNEMYGHITLPDWWGNDSNQLIPMQWMLRSVSLMVTMAMF